MALVSGLDAALTQPTATVFVAVQIVLPGHTVNLIEGSGVVSFPVNGETITFTGSDTVAGTILEIGEITEAFATQAPRVPITFMPSTTAGIAALCSPTAHRSPALIWTGAVNEQTGAAYGVELLFSGFLDTTKVNSGGTSRSVEVGITSGMDRFFMTNEAQRLTDTWHQHAWPGETGLKYMTGLATQLIWGAKS